MTLSVSALPSQLSQRESQGGRFYGFAYCFYNISRRPAALIRLALGRASFPQGKLLFCVGRHTGSFLRRDNRKVPGTAHRPFPTVSLGGCTSAPIVPTMRNAVLRLIPPPMAVPLPRRGRFCVVPFNHTGYICHAPGTAHRPFPTVSLGGFTSAPIVPTMRNAVLRLIHRLF